MAGQTTIDAIRSKLTRKWIQRRFNLAILSAWDTLVRGI
jgi:hypothetical protein